MNDQLVITSLPEQWDMHKDDDLNVLEGIINEVRGNGKEGAPVQNSMDLISIITARCVGTIDSRIARQRDAPLLDTFEVHVDYVAHIVDTLSRTFNDNARQATEWLKRTRGSTTKVDTIQDDEEQAVSDALEPACVDKLLDINNETSTLDKIQQIREEFKILLSVLSSQSISVHDFVNKAFLSNKARKQMELHRDTQLRTIRTHMEDIKRMDQHLVELHASITNLLDLKHRYANLFEARFSRYQATDSVRQGQTIMVFTIVTIVFLPLSFIATLFSINISNFPQGSGGEPSMSLGYVSQWVFGIGFAISIPLIITALNYETMVRVGQQRTREVQKKWRKKQRRTKKDEEGANWRDMVDGTIQGVVGDDLLNKIRDEKGMSTSVKQIR